MVSYYRRSKTVFSAYHSILILKRVVITAKANVESTISNFLDALATVDPGRMLSKSKCHILTHIKKDIERFGPPVLLSTEMFEGFNGVWRLCSILSNHHAPSRDIALNLADMDRFKKLASGVQWSEKSRMVKAGIKVRQFMSDHPEVQNYMGWVQSGAYEPGKHIKSRSTI